MVVDTSALMAILQDERSAASLAEAIAADPRRLVSAATALEAAIVVEARHGPSGGRELDLLLHRAGMVVAAFDADQSEVARGAWRRFGRGRHPAALNFGDCFSYALAVTAAQPLLCIGDDFAQTDVTLVCLSA
jgi:ribonuclease VapC